MKAIFRLIDNRLDDSLATQMRRQRFILFKNLLSGLPRPVTILDVGGTESYWKTMGFIHESEVKVVLLNITKIDVHLPNFLSVIGNASDMSQFKDKEFDVVFSNSVIEHLGEYGRQVAMAKEIERIGKRYFVQTPNKYFPIEPHFVFPFFQFLPVPIRRILVQHFNLGWKKKICDKQKAIEEIKAIKLLTERELVQMFSNATLYKEKFFSFTKSFIIYGGWVE